MSDLQRHGSRPPRRDGGHGSYSRGFRREGPSGPPGPAVDYKALVEYVAKALAEKPDEVVVEKIQRGGGTIAIKVELADLVEAVVSRRNLLFSGGISWEKFTLSIWYSA